MTRAIPPKLRAVLSEPRFWFAMLATALTWLVKSGVLLPTSTTGEVVDSILKFLSGFGIVSVAAWSPPREAWTNEQRLAHGLPPVPATTATGIITTPTASSPPAEKSVTKE